MKNRDQNDKGSVQFTYVSFSVEGGSTAIQDGLRQIATALAARNGAPAGRAALPATTRADSHKRDGTEAQVPLALDPPAVVEAAEVDVTPAANDGEKKPRRYTAPSIINGLDLDGDPSLEQFMAEKAPTNDNTRYLVAAVWFKQQKDVAITAEHIFTVYKRLNLPSPPEDVGMPLRNLKKDRLLDSGEKRGSYVVNDAGIAKVARMPGQ